MKRFLFVICFIIMNCLISFAYETGEEFKVSNNIIVRGEIPSKDNQSKIKTIVSKNTNIKIIENKGNDWTQIEWYDNTTKKYESGYVANIILNKDNNKIIQNTTKLTEYIANTDKAKLNGISKLSIEECTKIINKTIILYDFSKTWNNNLLLNNATKSLRLLYKYRGIRNRQMKLYNNALNDFNETIKYGNSYDVDLYIQRGICYFGLGQNEKSKAEFLNAKKLINKETHEEAVKLINNYLSYLEEQK